MKKIISIFLCILMLFSIFSVASSAVSYNESMGTLRSQFQKGYGPKVGTIAIDYSYYSPVKNGESTKYPLVVIFPGYGEGGSSGEELEENEFALWSSEELQSRFTNGGAYIMLLRSNEDKGMTWDDKTQLPAAKAAVDDFIAKNPNVDETKVYSLGWSFGGTGAMNFTVSYPNLVAAAVVISACITFTAADMKRLANTPVWMFQSKNDALALPTYGAATWNNLKAASNNPENLRYTTADKAPNTRFIIGHNMWDMIEWDTDRELNKYTNLKTVDGTGKTVEFNESSSIIRWLTANSLSHSADSTSCSHSCHKNGFSGFFWKIAVIFYRLFNVSNQKVCECGISHW